MTQHYVCCDARRLRALQEHPLLNGIDYVEVLDDGTMPADDRQRVLHVRFVKPLNLARLEPRHFRIDGGERRGVRVVGVTPQRDTNMVRVELDRPGDFSPYVLRLVAGDGQHRPPTDFDPELSAVTFSFKLNCASDVDCQVHEECPTQSTTSPKLDYLSKDFESFRQLMLDRLALTVPHWRTRHIADVGVTLVELLAYVGDYLSYQQDAIATEAYLGTARRRVSVRRHARLVDYRLDEGQNARTFVQIQIDSEQLSVPRGAKILSRQAGSPARISPTDLTNELRARTVEFETLHSYVLYRDHNHLRFYTWGARACCLPKGARRATLVGRLTNLKPGDFLVFAEVLGPNTGQPEDADKTRRHAVCLTSVELGEDPLGGRFEEPPRNEPVSVTTIEWAEQDALPFPLCVSSIVQGDNLSGEREVSDVSVAFGNNVLCDHGLTIDGEFLGEVPGPRLARAHDSATQHCRPKRSSWVPARFRPRLKEAPLTHAAPDLATRASDEPISRVVAGSMRTVAENGTPSAQAALKPKEAAVPQISLKGVLAQHETEWTARPDLLESGPHDRHFVVEIETDGTASIRFGDGRFGTRPAAGMKFYATYRVGNGPTGNVGADTLGHLVVDSGRISQVTNPLPAVGGREPESIEQARQRAPSAFQTQERAVTVDDYALLARRHPHVQRVSATLRWTGSWYTVFPSVDSRGGRPLDENFRSELEQLFERYRLAGHDIEIDEPRFVSLDVALHVCVAPDAFRRHVRNELLLRLGSGIHPNGRLGMFHPDRLTFGETVFMSRIVAEAQSVAGVEAVKVEAFRRQGTGDPIPDDGRIRLERLEIARLENSPTFPDHGVLHLHLEGGK